MVRAHDTVSVIGDLILPDGRNRLGGYMTTVLLIGGRNRMDDYMMTVSVIGRT